MNIQCDGSNHAKCNNANTDGRVNMDIHDKRCARSEGRERRIGVAVHGESLASSLNPPRGCGT